MANSIVPTFRNAAVSLFQSALHRVLSRNGLSDATAGTAGIAGTAQHTSMLATAEAALAYTSRLGGAAEGTVDIAQTCAKLYLDLAVAKFHGADTTAIEDAIKFSTCDPLWAEVIADYEDYLESGKAQPYSQWKNIGDFVIEGLPDQAKVALVSDWGTGTASAQALMEQVKSFAPDVLIHLGDIYYAGTPDEVTGHFLDVLMTVWNGQPPPTFTLSGNHDRYSGGQGYELLVGQLKQPANYFALRNEHWQLLAMDTGYHDREPGTVLTNVTWIEPEEASWHLDKINNAGKRGNILLSHHQLFSWIGVGDLGSGLVALNPKLHESFKPVLDKIACWFWGHEHNLNVFQPYAGLARGRCIGTGALPILVEQQPYSAVDGLILPPGEKGPPAIIPGTEIGHDGTIYNHAFTILQFDGPRAQARYYQAEGRALVPGSAGTPTLLYEESLAAAGT